jgi:hypothetical protein
MNYRNRRAWTALVLCTALAGSSACSVRSFALGAVGDALASGGEVYASDDDIELVGAATPFGLKTLESLLAEVPEHRGLLLAAARGFTQYAYAYVQLPAEEAEGRDVSSAYLQLARARRLYLRARDYGLRGLRLQGQAVQLQVEAGRLLLATAPEDVPLLYWTAVAWAAAIGVSKDSPSVVAGLPAVDGLIARAVELDADFDHGTLRTFLIGYEMSRPNATADAARRARLHFARAVELTKRQHAGPLVSLAESVAVAERNRNEFEALLGEALKLELSARPEWRLANLVMQRRARLLLSRADELFPE